MDSRYIAIHPHKGYLNTSFNIFSNFEDYIQYNIYRNNSGTEEFVECGGVYPNAHHSVHFNKPGDYIIKFNNGISKTIHIEDGYKFGGGKHKKSYVFDECPWVFIIMHDRTYFYNRETEVSYVETISPDTVLEVSSDYVIFQNNNQGEQTIYSLEDQCPILCVTDLICFNSDFVVWKLVNSTSDEYKLKVYSLSQRTLLDDIVCENYILGDNNTIYVLQNGVINRITLNQQVSVETVVDLEGVFLAFPNKDIAISRKMSTNGTELFVYDLPNSKIAGTISLSETLASINDNTFVNVYSRRQAISQFNIKDSDFPEASISADYCELNFYYTSWQIFYTKRVTSIFKSVQRFSAQEENYLLALNSTWQVKLESFIGRCIVSKERFCFYNSFESFVRGKIYSGSGYTSGGSIYHHKDSIILKKNKTTFTLSNNAYWDSPKEGDYNFADFEKYGIIRDDANKTYKNANFVNFDGNYISYTYSPVEYAHIGNSIIFVGGNILSTSIKPNALSPSLNFGVSVNAEHITLYVKAEGEFTAQLIMEDIFDTSIYRDVLLSEDGQSILYKDKNGAHLMNVVTGEDEMFDNLSYVKHINGMRTTFVTDTALQPRVVDPVSKKIIDHKILSQYKFISPKGDLYADTRLSEYTEYINKVTGEVLSSQDYRKLREKYLYPVFPDKASAEYVAITEERKALILKYFAFFEENYPKLTNSDSTGRRWDKCLLDEDNTYGVDIFLSRLFRAQGVAIIRRVSDDTVVAKIQLGDPLEFLNYVSFSYDSRYVSIVGYRCNGTFVLYDIESQNKIIHKTTQRAVWTTAFSINGAVSAYTSNPETFFINNYENENKIIDDTLRGYNFLAFSPDGQYFALSNQGYVSKYDINGNVRLGWGHQPSSLVNIRSTSDINNTIAEYNDLSDLGVADSFTRETVASISFSNSNRKLMMVGSDGVVVIRNLKLGKSLKDRAFDCVKYRVISREKMTQEEFDTIQSATITERSGEYGEWRTLDIITKEGAELSGVLSPSCSYPSGELDISNITIYLTKIQKMKDKDAEILCRWIVE